MYLRDTAAATHNISVTSVCTAMSRCSSNPKYGCQNLATVIMHHYTNIYCCFWVLVLMPTATSSKKANGKWEIEKKQVNQTVYYLWTFGLNHLNLNNTYTYILYYIAYSMYYIYWIILGWAVTVGIRSDLWVFKGILTVLLCCYKTRKAMLLVFSFREQEWT